VAQGLFQPIVDEQPALVSQGQGVPAAGLADHAGFGRVAARRIPGALRGGCLFFHRADDDEGHAYVEESEVPAELEEKVRRAALGCPERAIIIEE